MCIIPKEIETIDGLVEARNIVNRGWCQNQYVNYKTDQYCVAGAIFAAAEEKESQLRMFESFVKANGLTTIVDDHESHYAKMITIGAWNDAKGRTKEEVIKAFDKAIELCLKY